MNQAIDKENRAGDTDGRKQASARNVFALYFRDEIPDPFADPAIRTRVAQTIARAAMKGNRGHY